MKTNKYTPKPVNTDDVVFPDELKDLSELLSRNVHDNWALSRFREGWSYGPMRNDVLKQHPCLVDYDELPENEKEYDRKTALETLKTILKLGYCVRKP